MPAIDYGPIQYASNLTANVAKSTWDDIARLIARSYASAAVPTRRREAYSSQEQLL
jgi:hypothetical protein